jgi:hypothetical protein
MDTTGINGKRGIMATPKVFISYKNGHQASHAFIADMEAELAADFELLRDKNMPVGKPWTRELYDWLLGCDAAIIVLSKEANQSDWCRREWAVLVARWEIKGIPVIPVCMEDSFFETGILDDIQGTKGLLHQNAISKIKETLKIRVYAVLLISSIFILCVLSLR